MEVKIYDKDGSIIAEEKHNESIDTPGHYELRLSDSENGVEFIHFSTSHQGKEKDNA